MNQEEANALISQKLEEVKKLMIECQQLARDHNCYFDYSLLSDAEVSDLKSYNSGWSHSGCSFE